MSNVYARNRKKTKFDVVTNAEKLQDDITLYVMNEQLVPKKWRYMIGEDLIAKIDLKTRFYITETGRIIMKPCRESITRERRRLKKQAKLVESGVLTFDAVRCSYASYIGSLQHRDAYRTIQSMNRLFNRLFIEQWKGDQEHEQNEQQGDEDQRTD